MPDNAALPFCHALLRRFHSCELMRARHLLSTCIEDDEVANQVEQTALLAHLGERPVQKCASAGRFSAAFRLPLREELLVARYRSIVQPLCIVAGEDDLHRAEEG